LDNVEGWFPDPLLGADQFYQSTRAGSGLTGWRHQSTCHWSCHLWPTQVSLLNSCLAMQDCSHDRKRICISKVCRSCQVNCDSAQEIYPCAVFICVFAESSTSF